MTEDRRVGVLDRAPRTGLWAFFVVLVAIRFPATFRNPVLYAEEGNVYFAFAANNSVIDSVSSTHVGYYSLFANLAGIVSAAVPMEHAVTVMRVLGFVAPAVCAWIIIEAPLRRLQRAASLGVLVFTFTMINEWTSTIHAQFWFAVAVVLMLGFEPRGRAAEGTRYAIAVVAGLSGALAGLAAPAYAVRAVRDRRRHDVVMAAILFATSGLQFLTRTSREATWFAGEFVVVAFLKLAFHPFTGSQGDDYGPDWYASWTDRSTAVVFAVLLLAWITFVVYGSRAAWRYVAVTGLAIGLLGLYFALPPYESLAVPGLGGRYAVIGVVPVLIALVMSWVEVERLVRVVVVVVVALACVRGVDSGLELTSSQFERGPLWAQVVEAHRNDAGTTLSIDGRCSVSINAAEQRSGFGVDRAEDVDGTTRFTVRTGRFDVDVPVDVFVFAPGTLETLTPDGWTDIGGFLYGSTDRRCLESVVPVEPRLTANGESITFEVETKQFESIAERTETIEVGYGRDFSDALAKNTFLSFPACALLDDGCPSEDPDRRADR